MDSQYFPWLFFPAVGAIIGAVTNQIAIKMLFRPYREIRVGGMRLGEPTRDLIANVDQSNTTQR